MAKAKVITALALTTVMLVVMTGLAAADEEELQSCDVNGNPKDVFGPNDRIYVTDKSGVPLAEHAPTGKIWIVENLNWGPDKNGLNLSEYSYHMDAGTTYPDVYVSGVGVNSSGKFNGTHATNGIVDICAVSDLSGKYPDSYDIIYDADGDGYYNCTAANCPDKVDKLTCQGITTVPEFATIAIPAVAILGLFLFYNYRKRKEE
ncbi:hypothetical protein CW714_05970 [Methanophagales archaeon]|nr:MAG: hypothetical protein CW714_05970 [Methanophagales archaeon]